MEELADLPIELLTYLLYRAIKVIIDIIQRFLNIIDIIQRFFNIIARIFQSSYIYSSEWEWIKN